VKRRRGTTSIAANPVLIGAATTLIVVVAVFLAYNANRGLPFVPTYDLRAVVPNAANLVEGNEVRIGGSRVGVISEISPRRQPDGSVTAVLHLKLERAVEPLPVDSTVLVRPRSALGLKYLEITRGRSAEGLPSGATIPLAQATPEPVEIDEVLRMFDEPTRAGSRANIDAFGTALAGRGVALNEAIASFPPLLRVLQPVMENLADRDTDLRGLFRGLGRAAAEAAPVAERQASLFRGLDATFTALADVRDDVQASISSAPATLDAGIRGLPAQRPFLRGAEQLAAELRPGIRALRDAAPDLAGAFDTGTRTLRRSVALSRRLAPTFRALEAFATDPLSALGLGGLRTTSRILRPTVADLTPAQTVCNYITLFFRNAASLLSEGDGHGTWQRFIIVAASEGPNNEGGPSSGPARGGPPENFLHSNPYPNTPGGGRPNECEAGREGWLRGRQVIGNVPGNQGTATDRTRRALDGGRPAQGPPPEQAGGRPQGGGG
jgi:virulence factor Mce-like protein